MDFYLNVFCELNNNHGCHFCIKDTPDLGLNTHEYVEKRAKIISSAKGKVHAIVKWYEILSLSLSEITERCGKHGYCDREDKFEHLNCEEKFEFLIEYHILDEIMDEYNNSMKQLYAKFCKFFVPLMKKNDNEQKQQISSVICRIG